MQLKQTILALLSREALQEVCGYLDLDLNYRTKEAMARHLMRQESISADSLLPFLTDSELQAVCAACGVPATGRKATLVKRLLKQARGPTFVALDFETADYPRDSACALGLVRWKTTRSSGALITASGRPAGDFPLPICTALPGKTWPTSRLLPNYGQA